MPLKEDKTAKGTMKRNSLSKGNLCAVHIKFGFRIGNWNLEFIFTNEAVLISCK